MSTELRAKGIVISGLNESQGEEPHQVAFNLLSKIEPTLRYEDIDICYRLGSCQLKGKNVPKNLMVVFMGLGKKQLIMKKKNSLQKHLSKR